MNNYHFPREEGESWAEYETRRMQILDAHKTHPAVRAVFDLIETKARKEEAKTFNNQDRDECYVLSQRARVLRELYNHVTQQCMKWSNAKEKERRAEEKADRDAQLNSFDAERLNVLQSHVRRQRV